MITDEEKEEIINAAVERAMLQLPEVAGNLITNHVAMLKLNEEFYKDHPEFSEHKEAVAAIMEQVEGDNPLDKYEELLAKALPKIKERIALTKDLNVIDVDPKASRDYSSFGDL